MRNIDVSGIDMDMSAQRISDEATRFVAMLAKQGATDEQIVATFLGGGIGHAIANEIGFFKTLKLFLRCWLAIRSRAHPIVEAL